MEDVRNASRPIPVDAALGLGVVRDMRVCGRIKIGVSSENAIQARR
jgi:hypothetical protein